MFKSIAVIVFGGSLGCLFRWYLGLKLNALFPSLPPGTWAANMIGGYIVGVAVALFAANPSLAPEWRLLLITGFCGGLTTFSTFSAETFALLQSGRVGWALGEIAVHVIGSLLATAAGVLTYTLLSAR
ncbi:MAG: putative fluoride ion transporter CrcB [Stenotrophomonas maltophilia]|nr:MAG: putative fluoride ion transporter CrcB [Stenotrophomonas maltophilia]